MPDPILMAVAGAVAGKATEAVAKLGQSGYEKLKALVKSKFDKEPTAQAALEAAEADPSQENTARLAMALEMLGSMDARFDGELRQAGAPLVSNSTGNVLNYNSGPVSGDQFQAGVVNNYQSGT